MPRLRCQYVARDSSEKRPSGRGASTGRAIPSDARDCRGHQLEQVADGEVGFKTSCGDGGERILNLLAYGAFEYFDHTTPRVGI